MTPGEPRLYVPQLDGLRFVAFLGVYLSHVTHIVAELPSGRPAWLEWWSRSAILAGAFGVDLFFVLSSYLITSLLVREADASGRVNIPAFWMRRALRIWPLYLCFVVGCAVVGAVSPRMAAAMTVFVGNWAMIAWSDFAGVAGPLWSVSVEEQFYLTWPLVIALVPRRWLRAVSVGLVVVAVVSRYLVLDAGAGLTVSWLGTLSHLDSIGIGALIALAPRIHLAPFLRGALGAAAACALAACAGVVWFELMRPGTAVVRSASAATVVFLAAALACGGALVAALAGSSWLSWPVLRYLGRISYGLYVYHHAVISWLSGWSLEYRLPGAFVLTVAVAAVSYRFLELPFLRIKQRYAWDVRHTPASATVVHPLGAASASRER